MISKKNCMIYLTLLTFFPPGAITHNAAVGLLLNAIQVYLYNNLQILAPKHQATQPALMRQ